MESLPREIVLNILSRLPIRSLVLSRSVCRAWRSLIQDPELVHKHFDCMLENDPSFVLQSDHPIKSQLYLGDLSWQNDGNNMITKKLPMPPLDRFNLKSSCNGLLLLLDYHRNFEPFIYNPFTRNYQLLPDIITRRHNSRVFGFGFDPTAKEYKVVEISCTIYTCGSFYQVNPRPFEASVHILTIGSPTWRNLGTVPFHLMRQEYEALVNGKLHWVSYPKRNRTTNFIVSFDMATEKFQEVPLPSCSSSSSLASEWFEQVVVLRGCLSAVRYEDDNKQLEIWVMKEYGVQQSWSKEFSIGAYVPKILLELDGADQSFQNSRNYLHRKQTRVVCLSRSGEMLLEYKNRALAVYDSHCKTFKDVQLTFEGIPTFFIVDVHVASLNWMDTFINMANG